jgi:uncharacterized protein YqiB (DUF1249 family)
MSQQVVTSKRKRTLKNITSLHEANFKKISRVVPGLQNLEASICIRGQNGTRLDLDILEISKYTKTFSLKLTHDTEQPWLPGLHMKIRNYYDARVTEALAFQRQHRLNARYQYPNPNMFHPNEKWQTNHFLSEWLDHCLRTRCIFLDENEYLSDEIP